MNFTRISTFPGAFFLALIVSFPATANEALKQRHIGAVYGNYSELGGFDMNTLSRMGLHFGTPIQGNFIVFGEADLFAYDDNAPSDVYTLSLGGGYRHPLSPVTDLYGGVSWEQISTDAATDTGYGFRAGVRNRFTRELELSAEARYVDVGEAAGVMVEGEEDFIAYTAKISFLIDDSLMRISLGYDRIDDQGGFLLSTDFLW